jgi:hypothetical protein
MLSFAEEIYLLALDDVSGKIVIPSKDIVLNTALIGAALGELSFLNKIDTDSENLILVNTEPTGNKVLDEILQILREDIADSKAPLYHCLKILLPKAKDIENNVLSRLLEMGILKKVEEKILWFIPSRRYPIVNNCEIKDVESRLREIVLSDEIPDPRESVLISLVNTCDLFSEILSPKELRRSEQRIEELSKIDTVGREVSQLINQINAFRSMPPYV